MCICCSLLLRVRCLALITSSSWRRPAQLVVSRMYTSRPRASFRLKGFRHLLTNTFSHEPRLERATSGRHAKLKSLAVWRATPHLYTFFDWGEELVATTKRKQQSATYRAPKQCAVDGKRPNWHLSRDLFLFFFLLCGLFCGQVG